MSSDLRTTGRAVHALNIVVS